MCQISCLAICSDLIVSLILTPPPNTFPLTLIYLIKASILFETDSAIKQGKSLVINFFFPPLELKKKRIFTMNRCRHSQTLRLFLLKDLLK